MLDYETSYYIIIKTQSTIYNFIYLYFSLAAFVSYIAFPDPSIKQGCKVVLVFV